MLWNVLSERSRKSRALSLGLESVRAGPELLGQAASERRADAAADLQALIGESACFVASPLFEDDFREPRRGPAFHRRDQNA